jgi:hypothetical protein
MEVVSVPTGAKRMAVLLCCVVALDAAVGWFAPHPRVWCAIIPGLIPLMTPLAIFKFTPGRAVKG